MQTSGVVFLVLTLTGIQAQDPVAALKNWLKQPANQRAGLQEQGFAKAAISREQTGQIQGLLVEDLAQQLRLSRSAEWKNREIVLDKLKMKFDVRIFGDKPAGGRSLFISMHGGGNTATRVNDQQWENQKKLYKPAEGVYIAPRAPNDAWDMWFQPHMDGFFARLIEDAVVFEDVNVNRVYLMGYSAGGDGVFRLAPRMADRWAAASMMAGHPGDVQADNLRNLPFALHMGENDKAYDRNKHAVEWKKLLADLHEQDQKGYIHDVVIQKGMSHWMQGKDAVAIPWMAKYARNTAPSKIVWNQPRQRQFYWLADAVTPVSNSKAKEEQPHLVAEIQGQTIQLKTRLVTRLTIRLRDDLLDLDQPIKIVSIGKTIFEGKLTRTMATLATTLNERHDAGLCYPAEVTVSLP